MPPAIFLKLGIHFWVPCRLVRECPPAVEFTDSRGTPFHIDGVDPIDLRTLNGTLAIRGRWVAGSKGGPHIVEFKSGARGLFSNVPPDQVEIETAASESER